MTLSELLESNQADTPASLYPPGPHSSVHRLSFHTHYASDNRQPYYSGSPVFHRDDGHCEEHRSQYQILP